MREVTTAQAAQMLREADDILILTHQYPDGDTLGCAFAMCRGLLSMGKRRASSAPTRSRKSTPISIMT